MFKPSGPYCQSCGMPLSKDEGHGGTNADNSKNTDYFTRPRNAGSELANDYCSHCYQKGQFTEPNLTVQQMQEKVQGKLRQMHIPGFLTGYFTKDIPHLKRWSGQG